MALFDTLMEHDDDLKQWFVSDDHDSIYTSVPGLLDRISRIVSALNFSTIQRARQLPKSDNHKARIIARADHYQVEWNNPVHRLLSEDDLKAWCGQHPPMDPRPVDKSKPTKLKPLKRRQAIKMINEGDRLRSMRGPRLSA